MSTRKKAAPLLAAYLIVGENELMRKEAVVRLKGRLEPSLAVFNLDELEASSELVPENLLASLNTIPLGDGPRIVIIYSADHLSKAVSEALVSYLSDPNPGCTLCLVAEKLARNTRLYKAVAKVGPRAIVDCKAKKRWELPATVAKMGKVHDVVIDQDAAQELIARVGESTTMLDAQVKTLAAICCATKQVTKADVEQHIARTAEVKPWYLLDELCARDARRALSLYRLMSAPSQIALTALVVTRLRELICARSLAARGSASELAETLGKQSWQLKNHLRWAQGFTDADLRQALASSARCERDLKNGKDPDTAFTLLMLEICGVGSD